MYKIQRIVFNKNVDNLAKCKKIITDNNSKLGKWRLQKNIIDSVN